MDAEFKELVQRKSRELRRMVDDSLKISDSAYWRNATSKIPFAIFDEFGRLISMDHEAEQKNFALLCHSAPHIPEEAMHFLVEAHQLLSTMLDAQDDVPSVEIAGHLTRAFFMQGLALAIFAESPKTKESDRRKLLSVAGRRGARVRHQPLAGLKEWALKQAVTMTGDDMGIARKLSAQVPGHLANASKNPERLIYDTLRAERLKMK